jgi:hypothetical protein
MSDHVPLAMAQLMKFMCFDLAHTQVVSRLHLPRHFKCAPDDNWYIGVSDGVINVKHPQPAIQIHIAELRGNVLNTNYNLLDTIYSNTREFAIEPENVLFQPLGETVINFLSVTFTDRHTFPVQPIENSYLQFTLNNMIDIIPPTFVYESSSS